MLAYNQPLIIVGSQLSKLKSTIKLTSLLARGRFYAMAQAVIPKASPDSIYCGCGFVVDGLSESLGINDNKIISGIQNCIPSPSNLRYVVKKDLETKFTRIAGFVCNYICIMSRGKGERAGLGRICAKIKSDGSLV